MRPKMPRKAPMKGAAGRKAAVKRSRLPFLRDAATIRIVEGLLQPVQGHSRTVVINAVNQCIRHPERRARILKELASSSMDERDIVAAILSRVGRNKLRLNDFL